MASLTLKIDESTLRRARIRALEQGTSVNALVRDYLESYAGEAPARDGLRAFLAISERTQAGSGSDGRRWTRDDVHVR
jgi:plasmid stability protein